MMNQKLRTFLLAFLSLAFLGTAYANKQIVTVSNYQFTPANFTICVGDTIVWNWSNGSHTTTSTSVPSGAATWNAPMTSSATTYTYVATVAGSYSYLCTPHASFMTASFTVNGSPAQPAVTSGSNIICNGSTTMLSTTQASGVTYQWYLDNMVINGSTNSTYTAMQAGSYTVKAINTCGSTSSAAATLTADSLPTQPVVTPDNASACQGNSVQLSTATNTGAMHQWMLNGTAINGSTNGTFNATQSGTYTVRDSNICGGITSTGAAVTINTPPADPIINETNSGLVYTFTTTTTGTPAYSYIWDFGDGSAEATVQNPPPHTYSSGDTFMVMLMIADGNGCSSMSMIDIQPSLAVATVAGHTGYQLFPNPANAAVKLQNGAGAALQLYSNDGRSIDGMHITGTNDRDVMIDVSSVPNGIYMLKVTTAAKEQAAMWLSVQH